MASKSLKNTVFRAPALKQAEKKIFYDIQLSKPLNLNGTFLFKNEELHISRTVEKV